MATRFLKRIPGIYTVELEHGVHGVYRVVEVSEYSGVYCLLYRGVVKEAGSKEALDVVDQGEVVKQGGLLDGFARPPEWAFVAPAYPSEVYEPLAFFQGTFSAYAVDFAGTLKTLVPAGVKEPTSYASSSSGELFKDGIRLANSMEIEKLAIPPFPPHDGALLSDYFDEQTVEAKRKALDDAVPLGAKTL